MTADTWDVLSKLVKVTWNELYEVIAEDITNAYFKCTFCQKKIGIMGSSGQASEKRQDRGFFPNRLHLSRVVLYTDLRTYSHM
jgi:hypothetical protein